MDSSASNERFRVASLCERRLNERQKRVLDLIVEGKTNAQIGVALGITLDGAKWNVSEILTKLGLSSREEAAEYWRWRKRRRVPDVASALRALIPVPVLKWAGGVAVAGAIGVSAFVLADFAAPSSGAEASPRVAFEAVRGGGGQVRGWWDGPDRGRCETGGSYTNPVGGPTSTSTISVVRDGVVSQVHTVSHPDDVYVGYWPVRGGGPATGGDGGNWQAPAGASLDEFIEALEADEYFETTVVVERGEEFLGRAVATLGVTRTAGGLEWPGAPTSHREEIEVLFDEELGLVLRAERTIEYRDERSTTTFEVTSLDLDPELDESLWELEIPEGAKVEEPSPGVPVETALDDGTTTTREVRERAGLYVPAGQPDGWKLGLGQDDYFHPDGGGMYFTSVAYAFLRGGATPSATAWLTQDYPAPELDAVFDGAPLIEIDGHEARYVDHGDGVIEFAWEMDSLPQDLNIVRVEFTTWGVELEDADDLFRELFVFRD